MPPSIYSIPSRPPSTRAIPLDLAIDGDGYFVIQDGAGYTYTRAGNFYTDSQNYLVDSNGNYVMGYAVNLTTGVPTTPLTMGPILVDPNYHEVSINTNGQVVGVHDTTGVTNYLGQLVLATFANTNGLQKAGENMYRTTVNSGAPVYNTPGQGGTGDLNPGSLEMSNVDLTAQFADMITTQRGFQANSRIITTTDEMLEELVNMVR